MLVAYDGDTPVLTTLAIHGAGPRPTPIGVFTIMRRVANETMNSDTIGIPRFGPGGYYLTNVLFTQYFTGDGASIHYNYWSSNWGYAASHGCLGLTYADSPSCGAGPGWARRFRSTTELRWSRLHERVRVTVPAPDRTEILAPDAAYPAVLTSRHDSCTSRHGDIYPHHPWN